MDVLLENFVGKIVRNAPALIVLIICAMMMLSQRRHPRAAFRAALAFAWFLCTDILAIFWYSAGILLIDPELRHLRALETSGEFILSCCEGLGYIFFVFALNAIRTPYRHPFFDDFDEDEKRQPKTEDGSFTTAPRRPEEKPNE
jgi:hypothetical protein